MDETEIIQALCRINEMQSHIIREQTNALSQAGAVCMEDEICEVNSLTENLLGERD